jgi:hypothetical protein
VCLSRGSRRGELQAYGSEVAACGSEVVACGSEVVAYGSDVVAYGSEVVAYGSVTFLDPLIRKWASRASMLTGARRP